MLILDEPTNHLDLDARDALVRALSGFEGAVLLISHDPHLVELVADRLWLVAEGKVTPFEGDMAEYRSWLIEQSRSANRASKPQDDAPQQSRKDDRRDRAEIRKAQAPLRKLIKDAESKLAKLAAERATLEVKLADPALYTTGKADDVTRLNTRLAAIGKAQAELEEQWLEAEAELENAQMSDN